MGLARSSAQSVLTQLEDAVATQGARPLMLMAPRSVESSVTSASASVNMSRQAVGPDLPA